MVKLRKSPKRQDQKKSRSNNKDNVEKSTTMRAFLLSRATRLFKLKHPWIRRGHDTSRVVDPNTPPLTPDVSNSYPDFLSLPQLQTSDPLTPPHTPLLVERGSTTSSLLFFHRPRPVSSTGLGGSSPSINLSRPTSPISYRGVIAYRSPSLVQANSSAFHSSLQETSENTGSLFSRSYQSVRIASYLKISTGSNTDAVESGENALRQSSLTEIRPYSPQREVVVSDDSPTSVYDDTASEISKSQEQETQASSEYSANNTLSAEDTLVAKVDTSNPATMKTKKIRWRRTLSEVSRIGREPLQLRRENRRGTVMASSYLDRLHALSYDDTQPGHPPVLIESLKMDLPSAKTSIYQDNSSWIFNSGEFAQHPAVRPLMQEREQSEAEDVKRSAFITSTGPAPELEAEPETYAASPDENQSQPMSSTAQLEDDQCSYEDGSDDLIDLASKIDPVLDHENSGIKQFPEIEKQSSESEPSSDIDNPGGRNHVLVATPLEPRLEVSRPHKRLSSQQAITFNAKQVKGRRIMNRAGDVIAASSLPLAIMPLRKTDSQLTRFGSLHIPMHKRAASMAREKATVCEIPTPQQIYRFASLYGVKHQPHTSHEARGVGIAL